MRAWAPSQSPASGDRRNHVRPTIAVLAWLLVALAASPASAASPDPSAATAPSAEADEGFAPRFAHVMVIVMENQSLDDILNKNPVGAKYIVNELTPASGLAMKFYAPKRNSPTAYFAMASGHLYTEGDGGGHWAGKCGPSIECSSDDMTVFEQLNDAGRNWRIYSEDQTEPCQTKTVDKYWVGHNPAVFYTRLGPNKYTETGNGSCLKHDIAIDALPRDIAAGTVPEYTMVIPNNCNNMHDECYPIRDRVTQGNAWLQETLSGDRIAPGGLIEWARANDTLLIVTYDEARLETDREGCCPYVPKGGGGHIPTWVLGPTDKVKVGHRSELLLSNYSVLRAVQENWDLPLLGHAADPAVENLNDFLILTEDQAPVPPPNPPPSVEDASLPGASATAAAGAAAKPGATARTGAGTVPTADQSDGSPGIVGLVLALGVISMIGLVVLRLRSMADADTPGA